MVQLISPKDNIEQHLEERIVQWRFCYRQLKSSENQKNSERSLFFNLRLRCRSCVVSRRGANTIIRIAITSMPEYN